MPTPTYRRFPLWLTLLPLLLGIGIWALLWNGYRRDFEAALAPLLPAGTPVAMGGFPYRLEARVTPLALAWSGDALVARLTAADAVANRVPWQPAQTVLNLRAPELRLALQPLAGAALAITAPEAQASLRTADGRIARLSIVWQKPGLALDWLPLPVAAEQLEAHLRETPASGAGDASNPRLPTQDQLVLSARGMRFADGAPLALSVDAEVTADRPVTSLAAWLKDGTLEVRALALSDSSGEVARFAATLVPAGDGTLRIAGTVETVCPQSLRAAFAGRPAPSEKRVRRPERIAFTGLLPGGIELAATQEGRSPAPVRGQLPPCPRLR